MLKKLNHLKSNESSALVLKIPATTATILPNCETIIVERDRYQVQSRFLRINETDTESSLGFWESTRPRPRPGLEPPQVRDFNETETETRSLAGPCYELWKQTNWTFLLFAAYEQILFLFLS